MQDHEADAPAAPNRDRGSVMDAASTPLRAALSRVVGWAADRRIPEFLRPTVYRTYARTFGADLSEARLDLHRYPSLTSFFVRHLKPGARTFPTDPAALPSPADGHIQEIGRITSGRLLQAKGRSYGVDEMIGDAAEAERLEGGSSFTIYLSPPDYHRVHAPDDATLDAVHWRGGTRFSVRPSVLARRDRVLSGNERCVLRMTSSRGTYFLVLVGALNVGRIRVVGVEPGESGRLAPPRHVARGEDLARFEMGSTVVGLFPPGALEMDERWKPGDRVWMGDSLGSSR